MNAVWKIFWPLFCKRFQCFVLLNSLQEDGPLSRMTRCLFYVSKAEKRNVFFLNFLIWLLTYKCHDIFFLLRFWLHFVHSLCVLVCIILDLCQQLHLFSLFWLFQLLKNWVISVFFLDFRRFCGFQLSSFNMRQYWNFASKLFLLKFSLFNIFWIFLAAMGLFLNLFCL